MKVRFCAIIVVELLKCQKNLTHLTASRGRGDSHTELWQDLHRGVGGRRALQQRQRVDEELFHWWPTSGKYNDSNVARACVKWKSLPLLSRFPTAFHWPLCLEKLSLDVPLDAKAASLRRQVYTTPGAIYPCLGLPSASPVDQPRLALGKPRQG